MDSSQLDPKENGDGVRDAPSPPKLSVEPGQRNPSNSNPTATTTVSDATSTATDPQDDNVLRDLMTKRAELEAVAYQFTPPSQDPPYTGKPKDGKRSLRPDYSSKGKPIPNKSTTTLTLDKSDITRNETTFDMMEVVNERANLATAQEFEQMDKKVSSREDYNNPNEQRQLLQLATEINETAKMEKIEMASLNSNQTNRSGGTNQEPSVQPTTLVPVPPQQQRQQQQARPGAYMGAPGEALQRADTLRFSLVGVGNLNTVVSDMFQEEDGQSSMAMSTPVDNTSIQPTNNSQQQEGLAVANLVDEEDLLEEENQTRPSADPVDLEALEKKEQKQKQQWYRFLWISIFLILAAAIIVGVVAGTANKQEPSSIYSMEPSGVPSSAPTGSLDVLLYNLPNDTLVSLQVFGTPQWKAWDWLSNHQNITNLPEWRKEQLFALACFFYSMQGENWNPLIQERWMDDTVDECDWFSSGFGYFDVGIYFEHRYVTPSCKDGEFISLHLMDLRLGGLEPTIPPEIAMLTALAKLCLNRNEIAMPLSDLLTPPIYSLPALWVIELGGNQLTGTIPTQLGLLTTLRILGLNNNQLQGVLISEFGLLTQLQYLRCHYNMLSGQIPAELGMLTSVRWLQLAGNLYTGHVPPELGQLSALRFLWLGSNQLTGQIATEFGLLSNLLTFSTGKNALNGPIATELGLISVLMELSLGSNEFTSQIPTEIWNLTRLRILFMSRNSISGSLPADIGQLVSLQELDLSSNLLTRTIPSEVGLLTSLEKLYLYNNSLTGVLPAQLNTSMGLRLDGNKFTGDVPAHLCHSLWCDCSLNQPHVSTCSDLTEPSVFPGRFPPETVDGMNNHSVVLNIETDEYPKDTHWVWQQETNVVGVWNTLDVSGDIMDVPHFLYSFILPIAPSTTFRLLISDSVGDGFANDGWITLTSSNRTVLYAFEPEDPFTEIAVVLALGGDGPAYDVTSTVYCDPKSSFC